MKKKIFGIVSGLLLSILMGICFVVPSLVIKEGDVKISTYFIDYLADTSLSGAGETQLVSPMGIVVMILFMCCPIALCSSNKTLKLVSIAGDVAILAVAIRIKDIIKLVVKGFDLIESSKISLNQGGATLFLVVAILLLICALVDAVIELYGDKIVGSFRSSNKSPEEKLDQLASLLNKGYISKEEYSKRKAEILKDLD